MPWVDRVAAFECSGDADQLASDGKRPLTATGEACDARIREITDDIQECKQVQ